MKRKMITMILALVLAFSVAGAGWAAPPPLMDRPQVGKTQVACPVQHGKINKDLYVDYKGQRIYFCCPECIPIFKKNPEAYLKRMEQEGVTPEKAPAGK
jgi:YHS domain-containing protein